MKILVTGAGGFLGSRVGSTLLEYEPEEVVLHYRTKPASHSTFGLVQRSLNDNVRVVTGNLGVPGALDDALKGIDCVIHAAAGMRGAAADMVLNTVVATRNLLDSCIRAGVNRVVLVSSFSVYRTVGLRRNAVLDETAPLETLGVEKGVYAYVKLQQELLIKEYSERAGFKVITLRPGVIYGPGGGISPRVGIPAFGFFFRLGGRSTLPLTFVENCADAVARAAVQASPSAVFNVVDDDLPTCAQYLRMYRDNVRNLRVIPVPYWAFLFGARQLSRFSERSRGQLPATFTPYIVRSMYRPLRYSNAALRGIGWAPRMSTEEGLSRTFNSLRAQSAAGR